MANSLTSILCVSFAILLMVKSSNSVKCYYCLDAEEAKFTKALKPYDIPVPNVLCNDPLSDDQLVDCPTGEVCIKIDTETSGIHAIARMCAPELLCSGEAPNTECNACSTDKCNGAASMTATALLITVPAFLWKFY